LPQLENSEVVKYVLQKLIDISSRKTTAGHAVSTMQDLVKNLERKYNFLKNVEIKDYRFIEINEPITVMSGINKIKLMEVGKALTDIIKTMHIRLGEEAGHFFIKEFKNSLEGEYSTTIEEMGLDLGLMQLEFEVNKMIKKL
jgi:DNA integrity scanning protein DisA with diadenylate cyclase activity